MEQTSAYIGSASKSFNCPSKVKRDLLVAKRENLRCCQAPPPPSPPPSTTTTTANPDCPKIKWIKQP